MKRRQVAGLAGAAVAALVVVGGVQVLAASPAAEAKGLVAFGECDEVLAYYRAQLRTEATPYGFGTEGGMAVGFAASGSAPNSGPVMAMSDSLASTTQSLSAKTTNELAPTDGGAVGSGATGTNVQEADVDEPDFAKLSDGRLVVVAHGRLQIVSAGSKPRVLGSTSLVESDTPTGEIELFVLGPRILVITPYFDSGDIAYDRSEYDESADSPKAPFVQTRVAVYTVEAGDQPTLQEASVIDGSYISARLTDGTVRIVTSFTPQPPSVTPRSETTRARQRALAANRSLAGEVTLEDVLPQIVQTNAAGTVLSRGDVVGCEDVSHPKSPRGANTLVVTTLRPETGLAPTDADAVVADGDLVYAAADRLYVATSRWSRAMESTSGGVETTTDLVAPDTSSKLVPAPESGEVTTEIHAFDTSAADTTSYVASGSVPGYVLGRWAFSRYGDALRVATTTQRFGGGPATMSQSMIVKLAEQDEKLVETGRVSGLGKTEQIKSVRYFGDVAAVVTYRQTDPLYLVDLSGSPRVRGELEITGYSAYLHPIGDGKLLGIGMNANEQGIENGMQASVFDIGDLDHPTLVDRLDLGRTYSSVLNDSRAFAYDPARRLAMFEQAADGEYTRSGAPIDEVAAIRVSATGQLSKAGAVRLTSDTEYGIGAVRAFTDPAHLYAVDGLEVVAADPDTFARTGSATLDR